jgi:hypothetical protein
MTMANLSARQGGADANSRVHYIISAVVVVVIVVGFIKAAWIPLWNDEIFTVIGAKLPHVSDIWRYLADGADFQPPLYYVLVRGSIWLFRSDSIGARVPSLIAYVVFCACMYRFASRLTNKWYGLIAFLLPNVTQCWYYATEGRPYALLLAFTGTAMVSWQAAVHHEGRRLAVAGLAASLACAFNCHYYAPLIVIPFAIAEAVRLARQRVPDWPVYGAVAIATSAVFVWLGVALTARAHAGVFWSKPAWISSLTETATFFLGPSVVAMIGMIAVVIGMNYWPADEIEVRGRLLAGCDAEMALVVSMALLPVLGLVFAKAITHAYVPRYYVSAMSGFCIIVAVAVFITLRGGWRAGGAATGILLGAYALIAQSDVRSAHASERQPEADAIVAHMPRLALNQTLPIVFTNHHDFVQSFYYGNPSLVRRMYMVADPDCLLRAYGENQIEISLAAAARYVPMQVVTYRAFVRQHPSFYWIARSTFPSCTAKLLLEDGAHFSMIDSNQLFLVDVPVAPH